MTPNETMGKNKLYQMLSELTEIFKIDWFPDLGRVYMAFDLSTLMLKVPVTAKSWCCDYRNTITSHVCDREHPFCISQPLNGLGMAKERISWLAHPHSPACTLEGQSLASSCM